MSDRHARLRPNGVLLDGLSGRDAEPSRGGVRRQVVGHLADGLGDRGLPVGAEPGEGGEPVGEGQPTRVVDDRAQSLGVEGRGRVGGRAPLGPIAGDQEEDAGQRPRSSASCAGYVAPTTAPSRL